ncbi:MAG TPA: NAD+ synthase, partial [Acidimicrobiia bacterium]|nr:NAD+ synthase [Acidimicrobiia bacterium]
MSNSSPKTLRIALAQLHLTVGVDEETLTRNTTAIRIAYQRAQADKCDIVVAPELAVCGYSPEDLLLRRHVQEVITTAGDQLCQDILRSGNDAPVLFFGSPRMAKSTLGSEGEQVFPQGLESRTTLDLESETLANAVVAVNPRDQSINSVYKMHLPNWSVFDEARWFAAATCVAQPLEISGVHVGVLNCRDVWKETSTAELVSLGAQIIVVPNASPYANARHGERITTVCTYAKKYGIPFVYVNMVESCDEVVFDGGSFVVDASGDVIASALRFEQDFVVVDIPIPAAKEIKKNLTLSKHNASPDMSASLLHDDFEPSEAYRAIVLSLREYINSIDLDVHVALGLSGGVDSALVATIAVDALGADRVHGVLLPSQFTSQRSIDDAQHLSKNLGITTETISIEKLHEVAAQEFSLDVLPGIVSENVQARLRGMTLMMLSNSKGYVILATSNKSESAVGYFTLYGDSVGGFAPIKDVFKTHVYELCKWRNGSLKFSTASPIPQSIIDRAPTAELRDNQTDEESLYPYDVLDAVLIRFVDYDLGIDEIVAQGYDRE